MRPRVVDDGDITPPARHHRPGPTETDPSRARLRQLPENQPEDGVSPCCLDERFVIPEKGWHAGFPAPRVEAVDEVTQWIQSEMLAQRQTDPQGARARGPSAVRLMVGKPEQSTV